MDMRKMNPLDIHWQEIWGHWGCSGGIWHGWFHQWVLPGSKSFHRYHTAWLQTSSDQHPSPKKNTVSNKNITAYMYYQWIIVVNLLISILTKVIWSSLFSINLSFGDLETDLKINFTYQQNFIQTMWTSLVTSLVNCQKLCFFWHKCS